MVRILGRLTVVLMLLACGWSIGRAQTPQPDFELVVDAPVGATTVVCKRGCTLAWVERGIPSSTDARKSEFEFKCSGPSAQRCSSYTVGGWVTR
jgi:hypothetical protein